MLSVVLFHSHYDQEHLDKVKKVMEKKGAPVIRGFYDECNGIWFAVEGCHRLRAAKELGLLPIMKDISEQKTVTIQQDDENVKWNVKKLQEDIFAPSSYSKKIVDFPEEDDE